MSVFYRTVETYGGDYMEADCFPVFTESPIRGKKRRARFRPTSEVQERYNQKLAERRLVRLIHANFTEADYSIGLDYRDECLPEDNEEIKRDVQNFLARVRRLYKAAGVELRYVCVSAHGKRGGRAHHHLIISGGVDPELIKAKWKKGRRHCENLQFDRDGAADLADYIIRQAEVWAKRWCASRNLVQPDVVQDDVKLTNREARELADRSTSPARLWEMCAELWPGYELASVQSQYLNDLNGGAYFTLRLIRCSSPHADGDREHWGASWLKRRKKADEREMRKEA